jgi:hypothetical protein
MLKKEKIEAFEEKLKDKKITKVAWFEKKVDEELSEK